MNLRKLLSEVLSELNLPKPEDAYPFDGINKSQEKEGPNANATMYSYRYTNNNEDDMEITVRCEKVTDLNDPGLLRPKMTVAFSKYEKEPSEGEMYARMLRRDDDEEEYGDDPDDERKYSEKTGANDFIKVLATVVEAVKKTADDYAKGIDNVYEIAFAPSDKKRKNVYDHYIQSLFPDWKKDLTKTSNSWVYLINKNYKGK